MHRKIQHWWIKYILIGFHLIVAANAKHWNGIKVDNQHWRCCIINGKCFKCGTYMHTCNIDAISYSLQLISSLHFLFSLRFFSPLLCCGEKVWKCSNCCVSLLLPPPLLPITKPLINMNCKVITRIEGVWLCLVNWLPTKWQTFHPLTFAFIVFEYAYLIHTMPQITNRYCSV